MMPDPEKLLEIAGIQRPLIGFYDVPDPSPFEPLATFEGCIFSAYENWLRGESIALSAETEFCRGGRYWVCGERHTSLEGLARRLTEHEGFKASEGLMREWLGSQPPYQRTHEYVVIGPLREAQYDTVRTVTFFANPDQLSLLLLGTEYRNASAAVQTTISPFGSGCGQMAALFGDLDSEAPRAIIGATDIAMRQHLPAEVLALTVNRPMFRQLGELEEGSFLYKGFWGRLRAARGSG